MKAKTKVWVFVDVVAGAGVWRVSAKEYERLWSRASWPVRQQNDPVRASKEWTEFYNGSNLCRETPSISMTLGGMGHHWLRWMLVSLGL